MFQTINIASADTIKKNSETVVIILNLEPPSPLGLFANKPSHVISMHEPQNGALVMLPKIVE